MAGFRARSQLLASRLDESDEVLQQHFSDFSDEEEFMQQPTNKDAPRGRGKRDRYVYEQCSHGSLKP